MRSGLLRRGFVPPANYRHHLRLISRQMQRLPGIPAGEKNRSHKELTGDGIRLGVVVSDIHGKSGHTMVKALAAGQSARRL